MIEETESELHQPEQNLQVDLDDDSLESETPVDENLSEAKALADSDEPIIGDTADENPSDEADERDDELSVDLADGRKRISNRDRVRRIREADKFVNEGHRYWRRGRLGMAESSYLQALQVYPKYPRALVGMVRVHLKRRASVEALRSAKTLVRRKPRPSLYRLLLGDAYALDGNLASARSEWRIASRRGNKTARSRLRAKTN